MKNIDRILKWLYDYPELFSLIFFDGVKTNNVPYTVVETREPGYFQALSDAFIEHLYQYRFNGDTLSLEYIKNLHASCTKGVLNLNPNGSGRDISARASIPLMFDAIHNKILREKCYNALEQDKDRNQFFELCYIDTNDDPVHIPDKIPRNWPIIIRTKVNNEDNAECSVRTNESRILNILSDYHGHFLSANQPDEQIKHIIELVQRLERLHPFSDANCRTFCMMLLNLELIRHGMLPSLQDDPNYIDILPIDELIERVKNGQNRFKRYCEESAHPIYQDLNRLDVSINEQWFLDQTHQRHIQKIRERLVEYAKSEATLDAFTSENELFIKSILENINLQSFLYQKTVIEFLTLLLPTQRTTVINRINKNGRTLLEESSFHTCLDFFKTLLNLIPDNRRYAALTRVFPIEFNPFIRRAGQMVGHETILHRAAFNQNACLLHIAFEALPSRHRYAAAAATHPDPNPSEKSLLDIVINNPQSLTPSIGMAKEILLLLPDEDRLKALEKTIDSGKYVLKAPFQIKSAINLICSIFSNSDCYKILKENFVSFERMLEDICYSPTLFNEMLVKFAECNESVLVISTAGIKSIVRAIFSQGYVSDEQQIKMTTNLFKIIPESQRLIALLDLDQYSAKSRNLSPPMTLGERIRSHLMSKGLLPPQELMMSSATSLNRI